MEVVGTSGDNSKFTALFAGTLGSGDAGSLTINTRRLSIRDGASVATEAQSESLGQGEDLTVNASSKKLVEAQGWIINEQGQVILTASAPKVTPHGEWFPPVECKSSQPIPQEQDVF